MTAPVLTKSEWIEKCFPKSNDEKALEELDSDDLAYLRQLQSMAYCDDYLMEESFGKEILGWASWGKRNKMAIASYIIGASVFLSGLWLAVMNIWTNPQPLPVPPAPPVIETTTDIPVPPDADSIMELVIPKPQE